MKPKVVIKMTGCCLDSYRES